MSPANVWRQMARRQYVSNELIFDIQQQAQRSWTYLAFMLLAGVLSSVALLANSVPVLLGAMIVAPIFPPLALVALAFCGGQYLLARSALGTVALGLLFAVGGAVATTYLLNLTGVIAIDTNLVNRPLLEERVRPGWYSIIAALAAGVAGMIGIIKNKTDTLIGTVASVALVPAGGAAAIALISGDPLRALGGLCLLVINAALIIASGMTVVLLTRPALDGSLLQPAQSERDGEKQRKAS